jgi:hypothetical protein
MKLRACFHHNKYLFIQIGILKLAINVFSNIICSQYTTQHTICHMERLAVTYTHKVQHNINNNQINLQ